MATPLHRLPAGLRGHRAGGPVRAGAPEDAPADDAAHWGADDAVTALYAAHYAHLVTTSALLLHDVPSAEEVVQDAFVGMHGAWRRLRDPDKALAYLRQSVVNGSRSTLRRRAVAERAPTPYVPSEVSAEERALDALERSAVSMALATLPARQREAIVLRYYSGLSEHEVADAMGISRGAVKSHTSRALAALRREVGDA